MLARCAQLARGDEKFAQASDSLLSAPLQRMLMRDSHATLETRDSRSKTCQQEIFRRDRLISQCDGMT
jgi:hypothetical protein